MRVIFVSLDPDDARPASWEWLHSHGNAADGVFQPVLLPLADLELERISTPDDPASPVIWLHATTPAHLTRALAASPALHALFAPDRATGLLLTGAAVLLPSLTGLESTAPGDIIDRIWRDHEDELFLFRDFSETPRIRGHAAFRRHSLFRGPGSGVYTWWPHDGDVYRAFTYRLPVWPAAARVIAVERAFIHISPDRATIWSYRPRILCIGAYLPFESTDPLFRPHLEQFARNALLWVARPPATSGRPTHAALLDSGRDQYWQPPDARTVEDPSLPLLGLDVVPAGKSRDRLPALGTHVPLDFETATLRMAGAADPFTIAGRRAFAAGSESTGIDEIWVHPLRIMKDARITPRPGMDIAIVADSVDVTSLGIERRFRLRAATGHDVVIVERSHVVHERPAVFLQWTVEHASDGDSDADRQRDGDAAAHVVDFHFQWLTDLRLMWPYPAGALGPLHYRTDDGTLVIRAPRSGETACFIASGAADAHFTVTDASSDQAARVQCSLIATLAPGQTLVLRVIAATGESDEPAAILEVTRAANSRVRARSGTLRRLQQERLQVEAPDPRVGEAIEWARLRLDAFLVETPGVGRSLVAGYWTSRPGWNDGRPGYAWYFGRDAVWTAFASLAAGDFDAPRDVLAFLAANQDLTGKILHECTTSGSIHYDAADSTPLFLLLAAKHHAWTGETGFIHDLWPAVRRALDFCIATDTDGDGLIENPRVGHGWIEFGRLGGGRATFYNAGIWAAALRELVPVTEALGDIAFAADLRARHRRARTAIAQRFLDDAQSFYALRIDPADYTPTATHAVPLLLEEADVTRSQAWLDLVASDAFTADWGVRMVPASDPGFRPDSYHGGAVWPLYTGWTAWAEYVAGRAESGFRHWRQIIDHAFSGAKGAWDEVLHGTEPRAIGVCPDQAWSAAMAIAPLVHGMLGLEPDAARGRLTLRPRLPAEWDRFQVTNLRVGDARLALRFRRDRGRHIFRVDQVAGSVPLRLVFEPAIPGLVRSAAVDGQPAVLATRPFGDRCLAPVQLVLDHERTVELETGI